MSENQLQVNPTSLPQEVVSLEEAAHFLGVGYKAVHEWLRLNRDIRDKHCFKQVYKGRRKTVITAEGVTLIAAVRNLDGKVQTVTTFREGKKNMVEAVAENRTLEARVKALEERLTTPIRLKANPLALPMATEEPAPISHRSLINQRVRKFAEENGEDYYVPWGRLYEEVYYRHHVNLRKQAKTRGIKPIDVLAAEGLLEEVWRLSCKLFPLESDNPST